MTMSTTRSLAGGLGALPGRDRALLIVLVAFALIALALGVGFGAATASIRARFAETDPETGYRLMTLHGVDVFFYWLYLAQSAVLLAFAAVYREGRPGIAGGPVAWLGTAAIVAGFVASQAGTLVGTPLLYDGSPEVAGDDRFGPALFYLGYLLLGLGLFLVAAAAVATALAGKRAGGGAAWSSIAFGTVGWAGLVMVSSVGFVNAFLPSLMWALDLAAVPADHTTGWHVLFHNLHYLPLMGTVLIWYALMRDLVGVGSLFGERFSKIVFASYLLFVPPTSLYHMFLEPDLAPAVRVLGSLLSLFVSVPTVAAFLIIVVTLEAWARASGARGWFGWIGRLPWRDPAMAASGAAVVNLALGGTFSFVLIQEKLAPLLSDTFFVPAYFHFLTVGTVTLTLLAAFLRMIPALTGRAVPAAGLLRRLPVAITSGVAVFGLAGIAAGLNGMPRRALDVAFDGDGPGFWLATSTAIGVGAAVMAAGLAAYVVVLAWGLCARPRAAALDLTPPAGIGASDQARVAAAWTGPASVALLVAAMYAATWLAFQLMQSLPVIAAGGGGH